MYVDMNNSGNYCYSCNNSEAHSISVDGGSLYFFCKKCVSEMNRQMNGTGSGSGDLAMLHDIIVRIQK